MMQPFRHQPHGCYSVEPAPTRTSALPSKKEAVTVTSLLQKDPPNTQFPFLPRGRGSGGSWQKPRGEKAPKLGNTHLVFSGTRAPPVPNFSCRLRTSRGGFTAEFTKAILATLPTGVQKETVLRSSLTQRRLFGICLTAASSQHLSPARPSPSSAESLLLRSAPLQSHCLL